jgi:hypothetical protein
LIFEIAAAHAPRDAVVRIRLEQFGTLADVEMVALWHHGGLCTHGLRAVGQITSKIASKVSNLKLVLVRFASEEFS